MSNSQKENRFTRREKPIFLLVCEGKNKTETLFFKNFISRENNFNLKIDSCEATDPIGIAKRAYKKITDDQLDNKIGDRVFCIADIDLSSERNKKINEAISKYGKKSNKCKIEFIRSNPCFETWLLYYFTKDPKCVNSSAEAKKELKNFDRKYKENYDIYKNNNLSSKNRFAIDNSEAKNKLYSSKMSIEEKNPYTEVHNLIKLFLENEQS